MSLFIEEEGTIKLDFNTEEIAALVIDAALELADCPYEAEINLLLTENAQIHEMNLEQRGIDRPSAENTDFFHDFFLFHFHDNTFFINHVIVSK